MMATNRALRKDLLPILTRSSRLTSSKSVAAIRLPSDSTSITQRTTASLIRSCRWSPDGGDSAFSPASFAAMDNSAEPQTAARPAFAEAFKVWLKIGCINFGGPAGQIAMMHRVLVEEKKWIDEPRFLHALNFCVLSPGPEATKLATYIGWLLNGVTGGLVAGVLFVLPGAL